MFAAFVPLADFKGTKLQSLYSGNLSDYFNIILVVTISVGATIAVLRLVVAGSMYMGSDLWQNKAKVREWITDVFIGLFFLLSLWIVLNQINPDILKFRFLFPEIPAAAPAAPLATSPTAPDSARGSCTGCVPIPSGVPMKMSRCAGQPCMISATLAEKLKALSIKAIGMSWRVTEAWPPEVSHASPCHYNGTCFDANITGGNASPQEIKTFIAAARDSGLNAKWEVGSESRKQQLVSAGVGANSILVPSRGTNTEHFHITGN